MDLMQDNEPISAVTLCYIGVRVGKQTNKSSCPGSSPRQLPF